MSEEGGGGGGGILSDFFFFLGIIILFFFVWVASGGPSRPISFQGPYLSPITNTGTNAEVYGDPNSYGISSGINVGGWGATISGENASSQAGVATFVRDSSGAINRDAKSEYVTIMLSSSAGEVSTAGWKLVSEKSGEGVALPEGAENPRFGKVNVLTPITLSPGDTMIVSTGRSPVGVSFRENMCTGYFEERQDFRPPLLESCPTPYQEYTRFYDDEDDECEQYVRSIPYCSTDTDVPSNVSGSCEDFVEEYISYDGCIEAHEGDENFHGRTWRVFLGKSDELWANSKETILLLDASGKVIDAFSY